MRKKKKKIKKKKNLVPCDVRAKGVSSITTVIEGRHTIHVKMFQWCGFLRASDVEYIQKDERIPEKKRRQKSKHICLNSHE
jgi:hypothetical protein